MARLIDADALIPHWIDHQYKEFPIGRYECSVCGAKHDMEWNYCPNCGASMSAPTQKSVGKALKALEVTK